MPPILRSVVAQCYRRSGGRSTGFRQAARNFCSSPPGSSNEPSGVRKIVSWFTLRALPAAAGYGIGALILGGSSARYREEQEKYEEKQLEILRKMDEIINESRSSGLAKPRIVFVSDRKF